MRLFVLCSPVLQPKTAEPGPIGQPVDEGERLVGVKSMAVQRYASSKAGNGAVWLLDVDLGLLHGKSSFQHL